MGLSTVVFPFGRLHKKHRGSWTMVKSTSAADCQCLWLRGKKRAVEDALVKISIKPTCTLAASLCCSRTCCESLSTMETYVVVPPLLYPTPPCGPTQVEQQAEYEPGTGALTLFPNVHLETCDESAASVQWWSWRPATSGRAVTWHLTREITSPALR